MWSLLRETQQKLFWTTNLQGWWRWVWLRGVGAVALRRWGAELGGRVAGGHWKHFVKSPNVSIWCTKFVTLAHPPNPNPTTKTHTTTNTLIVYVPIHLPTNFGGCSTAFCNHNHSLQNVTLCSNERIKTLLSHKYISMIHYFHINTLRINGQHPDNFLTIFLIACYVARCD